MTMHSSCRDCCVTENGDGHMMDRTDDGEFSLRHLLQPTPGFLRLAQCISCTKIFPLPLDDMIATKGIDATVDDALRDLTCPHCGGGSIKMTMAKDP